MLTVGVDIIELERIARVVERWGDRFLRRIYTEQELAYCRGRIPQLAARFAAKEAVMKALGTGVRGVGWRDVEVVRRRGGAPTIALHSRAERRAEAIGVTELAMSISHSRNYAVVSVVGVRDEARHR
jgi:holo-[acyl-carrier protein] synthase